MRAATGHFDMTRKSPITPENQFIIGSITKMFTATLVHQLIETDKVEELKVAGANDFMQKPFSVDVLLERCCGMLDMEPVTARR